MVARKGLQPVVSMLGLSPYLYNSEGFQAVNRLNRSNLSSWMRLHYIFQNETPGVEDNWLPAPKGAFNLLMRLCATSEDAHRQVEPAAGQARAALTRNA